MRAVFGYERTVEMLNFKDAHCGRMNILYTLAHTERADGVPICSVTAVSPVSG